MKKIIAIAIVAVTVGITSFLLTTVEAGSITKVSPASFGDACKNVKFQFKNNHSSANTILIFKVEYYNRANGKWQTEEISNGPGIGNGHFNCRYNTTCTTLGDNLRDSEGEQITKVRFIYQFRKADGRWSDNITSRTFEPASPVCNANKTYGNSQGWTIGEL